MNQDYASAIPELNISTYRFKLFDKEVFLILKSDQYESFNLLFSLLNQRINYDEALGLFIQDYVERHNLSNAYSPEFILKNLIGNKDIFHKIEEHYRILLRDKKIDDINEE